MFSYFKLLSVSIILVALFLILLIYYFDWELLDDEVKSRIKFILTKYVKKTK